MSHRTEGLPPLTGPARWLRELRYHEASRQSFAIILVALFCATASPVPLLVAIGLPIGLAGELFRLYASGFIVKNQELAIEYLVRKAGTLAPQVYPVPRELDEQISRAKLEAMGMRIDKMTEEQAIYAKSWKAGT